MAAMDSDKFRQICDGVWCDRVSILTGRGAMSGEVALLRAVYWRLCKAGGEPGMGMEGSDTGDGLFTYRRLVSSALTRHARPHFDGAPFIEDLLWRCRDDAGLGC
ncbi:MAG: hypothetical protein ACRD9R_09840 [Pyrinomonadaceae bacterium]